MKHRSRGRLKYRNFNIHERINWKSYWWGYSTIIHYINSNVFVDFPAETIEESQTPCEYTY